MQTLLSLLHVCHFTGTVTTMVSSVAVSVAPSGTQPVSLQVPNATHFGSVQFYYSRVFSRLFGIIMVQCGSAGHNII